RRGDHRVVLSQELARALYWPILPVHGMIHELGRAREELCDNHVLHNRDAVSYGETLLHLAELSMAAPSLRAVACIRHGPGELEDRMKGLLDQRRSCWTRSSRWLACFVVLLFLAGGTIAAATRFVAAGRESEPSPGAVREGQAPGVPQKPATPARAPE